MLSPHKGAHMASRHQGRLRAFNPPLFQDHGSNKAQEWGRARRLTWGVTLQDSRDWRKGTFGSHYRTEGQGARKQRESRSEVPPVPRCCSQFAHLH